MGSSDRSQNHAVDNCIDDAVEAHYQRLRRKKGIENAPVLAQCERLLAAKGDVEFRERCETELKSLDGITGRYQCELALSLALVGLRAKALYSVGYSQSDLRTLCSCIPIRTDWVARTGMLSDVFDVIREVVLPAKQRERKESSLTAPITEAPNRGPRRRTKEQLDKFAKELDKFAELLTSDPEFVISKAIFQSTVAHPEIYPSHEMAKRRIQRQVTLLQAALKTIRTNLPKQGRPIDPIATAATGSPSVGLPHQRATALLARIWLEWMGKRPTLINSEGQGPREWQTQTKPGGSFLKLVLSVLKPPKLGSGEFEAAVKFALTTLP